MFDFPTFHPNNGDHHRYNEQFFHDLAKTLIDEVRLFCHLPSSLSLTVIQFPVRPHWTKNTREVFQQAVKNIDPEVPSLLLVLSPSLMKYFQKNLSRFKAVREQFDPQATFKSVVGEIIGVY